MSDEIRKLRNEVQLLRDELAIMQRKYEDILYNLDDENFSSRFVKEKGDMKTAIEVTAEGIKTKVSNEELEKYTTKEQTAEHIKNIVFTSATRNNAIEIGSYEQLETEGDKAGIYVVRKTDSTGNILSETYYYYDDITEKWEVLSGENIFSVFEQTATGFKLKGNVLVDGSCVITDTLTFNSASKPVDVQYSSSGAANSWHDTFNSGSDKFMRIKIGSQWSSAMKVVGDDGGIPEIDYDEVKPRVSAVLENVYKITTTSMDSAYIESPEIYTAKIYSPNIYGENIMLESKYDNDESVYNQLFLTPTGLSMVNDNGKFDENGKPLIKEKFVIDLGDDQDNTTIKMRLGAGVNEQNQESLIIEKYSNLIRIGTIKRSGSFVGIAITPDSGKLSFYATTIEGIGGGDSGGCDGTCVATFA